MAGPGWLRRGALPGLLALKLLLAGALLHAGFVALSGDEFLRALIAQEWARRPFLLSTEFDTASSLWLPLPFWLNGAILRIVPRLSLVPVSVNVTLSLGGLLYLCGIARRLFDHTAGLLTVILVAALPWHVWLSISGMAEIPLLFFLSAAFYYLCRWETQPAARWALLSGLAALGGTMVRPEGWLYAVPLSARFATDGLRTRRWSLLVAAAAPWGFVGCWLLFNYVAYGEPWHFIHLSRGNFQRETVDVDSIVVRLF